MWCCRKWQQFVWIVEATRDYLSPFVNNKVVQRTSAFLHFPAKLNDGRSGQLIVKRTKKNRKRRTKTWNLSDLLYSKFNTRKISRVQSKKIPASEMMQERRREGGSESVRLSCRLGQQRTIKSSVSSTLLVTIDKKFHYHTVIIMPKISTHTVV